MREYFTFYFWFRTKIKEKANFYICCFQIIDQLNLVFLRQMANSLQLENYRIKGHYIRFVVPHWLILIIDCNLRMSYTRNIPFLQFPIQCILIHILYESIS